MTRIGEYGIIIHDNRFLMLRFSLEADPKQRWIFPGGRLDKDDKPEQGLLREMKEETDLKIEIVNVCDVKICGVGEAHRYAVFFICKLVGGDIKLSHEHSEYKWFGFDEIDNIDYSEPCFRDVLNKIKPPI